MPGETQKIILAAVDYDGALGMDTFEKIKEDNPEFIKFIVDKIDAACSDSYQSCKIILAIGSNRQNCAIDKFNADNNRNGFCVSLLPALQQKLNEVISANGRNCFASVGIDEFLMPDIYNHQPPGTTLRLMKDAATTHMIGKDLYWIFDPQKISNLYTLVQHIASKYPESDVDAYLFDDIYESILLPLTEFFSSHSNLLPTTCSLFSVHYKHGQIESEIPVIKGTGEIAKDLRKLLIGLINQFHPDRFPPGFVPTANDTKHRNYLTWGNADIALKCMADADKKWVKDENRLGLTEEKIKAHLEQANDASKNKEVFALTNFTFDDVKTLKAFVMSHLDMCHEEMEDIPERSLALFKKIKSISEQDNNHKREKFTSEEALSLKKFLDKNCNKLSEKLLTEPDFNYLDSDWSYPFAYLTLVEMRALTQCINAKNLVSDQQKNLYHKIRSMSVEDDSYKLSEYTKEEVALLITFVDIKSFVFSACLRDCLQRYRHLISDKDKNLVQELFSKTESIQIEHACDKNKAFSKQEIQDVIKWFGDVKGIAACANNENMYNLCIQLTKQFEEKKRYKDLSEKLKTVLDFQFAFRIDDFYSLQKHLKILGVDSIAAIPKDGKTVTDKDVYDICNKNFRDLSSRFHPDKMYDKSNAEKERGALRFQRINECFQSIKKAYDAKALIGILQGERDENCARLFSGRGNYVSQILERIKCREPISLDKERIDKQDATGKTLLMHAVIRRDKGLFEMILKLDANVHLTDSAGFSALHYASQNSDIEISNLLIQRGANPFRINCSGSTPLSIADTRADKKYLKFISSHVKAITDKKAVDRSFEAENNNNDDDDNQDDQDNDRDQCDAAAQLRNFFRETQGQEVSIFDFLDLVSKVTKNYPKNLLEEILFYKSALKTYIIPFLENYSGCSALANFVLSEVEALKALVRKAGSTDEKLSALFSNILVMRNNKYKHKSFTSEEVQSLAKFLNDNGCKDLSAKLLKDGNIAYLKEITRSGTLLGDLIDSYDETTANLITGAAAPAASSASLFKPGEKTLRRHVDAVIANRNNAPFLIVSTAVTDTSSSAESTLAVDDPRKAENVVNDAHHSSGSAAARSNLLKPI